MRTLRAILITLFAFLGTVGNAAPNFVTSAMLKRNGLTDEQYQYLWSIGKRPQIDIGAAREWMFRASRYGNVTNWLDICGKTNDFAKLSFKLQDENFVLSDTNKVLVASNSVLRTEVKQLEPDAKALRKAAKAAEKAAEKDAKNYTKWLDDTEKLKKKSSAEFAGFLDAMITIATNAVPIPPNK